MLQAQDCSRTLLERRLKLERRDDANEESRRRLLSENQSGAALHVRDPGAGARAGAALHVRDPGAGAGGGRGTSAIRVRTIHRRKRTNMLLI